MAADFQRPPCLPANWNQPGRSDEAGIKDVVKTTLALLKFRGGSGLWGRLPAIRNDCYQGRIDSIYIDKLDSKIGGDFSRRFRPANYLSSFIS